MIKNPLDSILTADEQKILGFLSVTLIVGMLLYYSGFSAVYAKRNETDKTTLKQATQQDSIIRIDIRTADKDELILLPGIGEKRAQDIIAYRQSKQFESTEELLNIKGIGAKTFLKMQPMLMQFGTKGAGVLSKDKLSVFQTAETTSGDTSAEQGKQGLDGTTPPLKKEQTTVKTTQQDTPSIIRLNSASKLDLMSLNGIGEKKADAILEYRKQIGKFTSVEQLLDVKGIGVKTLEKNRHRLSL